MRQSYIRVNEVSDHFQVSALDKMHLGSSSSAETLSLMLLVGLGVVCRSGAHDAYSKQLRSRREFLCLTNSLKKTYSFAWQPEAGLWWT